MCNHETSFVNCKLTYKSYMMWMFQIYMLSFCVIGLLMWSRFIPDVDVPTSHLVFLYDCFPSCDNMGFYTRCWCSIFTCGAFLCDWNPHVKHVTCEIQSHEHVPHVNLEHPHLVWNTMFSHEESNHTKNSHVNLEHSHVVVFTCGIAITRKDHMWIWNIHMCSFHTWKSHEKNTCEFGTPTCGSHDVLHMWRSHTNNTTCDFGTTTCKSRVPTCDVWRKLSHVKSRFTCWFHSPKITCGKYRVVFS